MTLELVKTAQEPRRLDRAKWHKPLVSVIVTHFDYSDHIEDALLSLLDQTHENWECVVMDDGSDPAHVLALEAIITRIDCDRIRLVRLEENVGQIGAFFAGLTYTSGEFVCLLDPDDRYDEEFLEATLACHLNQTIMCPLVSTDQCLVQNGSVIAMVNSHYLLSIAAWGDGRALVNASGPWSPFFYTPAEKPGWHWTSTSSLMMRRAGLAYLKPHKELYVRNSVDSYVAQGLHRLGGTIFLAKPLVYRTIHDRNEYISDGLFSSRQNQARPTAANAAGKLLLDAIEALEYNGAPKLHGSASPSKKPGLLAKWRRSVAKRRQWLADAALAYVEARGKQ